MDNKEAIEYLKWIRPIRPYSLDKIKVQESIDLAIKILEESPQGDLISRDALIDVLKTELANVPQPDTDADYYVGVHQGLKLAETIIDNASSVYDNPYSDGREDGYIEGYEEAKRECELQDDIRWTDKLSIKSNGDIIGSEGRVVGHIDLDVTKSDAE